MAMTPDTRSILTSLRFMKDSELQQYAAMHKNDPFIFPLAFQESQMRKQVRAEEQAKQQQPQAKVVDQNLAAMAAEPLPEDVGIAQLPANNLQGIATGAAGGIVAFDEGGEVPRFNGTAGSFVGPQYDFRSFLQQMGISPQQFLSSSPLDQKNIRDMFNQTHGAPQAAAPATGATPAQTAAKPTTMWESIKQGLRRIRPGGLAALDLGTYHGALNENEDAELAKRWKGAAFGHVPLGATDASLGAVPTVPVANAGDKGVGGADQGGKTPPPPAPPKAPTVAPTTFKPAEAPSLASAKELAGQLLDTGAYKKSIEDYQKAEQDAVDAARLARKEGKPEGKAYEEYEKTLRDETADLGKRKGEAQGEAWLTAGLAVLGGSSPYALQNLSLATKGVEQYRDAMKDIRKATRENAKGLADIAQARRAEERGDWEKTQEFEERASTRMSNARKFGVEGIMGLGVKNAELAGRAYDTQVTQAGMDRRTFAELQSRENIARAQVAAQIAAYNAPGQQERLFSTLGGGDVAKGLGVYASTMGPEARGIQGLLAKYADPIKLQTLKATDPDLYNFVRAQLSMQMMPNVMSKPTGAVRD